ncbi:hypothetical protein V5799_024328 [Amblyomma americanum]|uniref:C2H2-type domain-containing protein n=1 Tax=Amblyomma americanum TaxID=6943 RepID=A0AAQ4ECB7_AMBAM
MIEESPLPAAPAVVDALATLVNVGEIPDACSLATLVPQPGRHLSYASRIAAAAGSSAREKTFACDLCCNAFLHRRELLQHHEQEHGFMARRSTVQFSSIAEFQAWKEKTERKEQAHFIAKRGVTRLSSVATKRYLECHRTGVAVQSGQGKRQPKAVGSVKCNKHCFAVMVITQDGETVTIEYQAEHYGHEKSVTHLRMSATEVAAIAQKLGIGVPIRRILADALIC